MMSNGHLPAGRAAQGGGAVGAIAVDAPVHDDRGGGGPGGGMGPGGGGGGGRNGGGRRGRHYGSHYQMPRHNQNGYHNQNNHHNQYGHQLGQQLGQPMYPSYMGPYVNNPYAYAQIPPQYAQNGAMPNGFVPFQQAYGRPMAGGPAQYAPLMAPGALPMPQTAAAHQPPHPSLPPHPQHLQHSQHPQHPVQHHIPPPPHMSPYSRNDPVIVSTTLPPQPLPSSLPPLPPAHTPLHPPLPGLHQHMPLLPRADILQPPPHIMQPPLQPPVLPPTPSSTLSSHAIPTPLSPEMAQRDGVPFVPEVAIDTTAVGLEAAFAATMGIAAVIVPTAAFRPPLPWLSRPDVPFPAKSSKLRRRRKTMGDNVELPQNLLDTTVSTLASTLEESSTTEPITRTETPSTQDIPSEDAPSTSPTTPSSVQPVGQVPSTATPTPTKSTIVSPKSTGSTTRTAVPIIPAIPMRSPCDKAPASETAQVATVAPVSSAENGQKASMAEEQSESATPSVKPTMTTPPAPQGPKLWSGLFNRAAAAAAASAQAGPNGSAAGGDQAANGANGSGAFSKANANSLAEALIAYRVDTSSSVPFIEPRGLINTGNMCYMNSVLQVLIFCTPFYDFLDQVSRKAAYSFKSETPLLDAMIMFIREFRVIDTAEPVELRRRLKNDDLERYGDAFTPEFVYEAIKQLSRFESMRRGHQQDAEEFLGFLLECLNEECTKVVQDLSSATNPSSTQVTTPTASVTSEIPDLSGGDGWLEVGPRQRAAITRSSGHTSTSPVNSIFGGKLRSELRVPGLKDSVTLEPYQSLQLDIDSPQVRNILDALCGLTKPEVLHGDFGSPHGKDVSVTKQVFIETLPPVLILHLKRFQFDWQGNGTVKIWKKIGYPLELEIPREIFGRQKRNKLLTERLPKYRLNAVVYHHGKQASGGHYTVDVLREDGREWIRLDDTVIRRIRSDDVAESGAEEAVSGRSESNAVNGNGTKNDATSVVGNGIGSANRFAGMGDEDAGDNENGWRQVTAPVNGANKKWSSVANDSSSPINQAKQHKDSIKDNKVAYLLFYQRVN